MANPLSGLIDRGKRIFAGARRRAPWFDHVVRAYQRYSGDTGDRLAAAVTFFGFLSFFPVIALALSIAGFVVVVDAHAKTQVVNAIAGVFPGLIGKGGINVDSIASARAGTGVVGLVGLLLAGLGWVDALRDSIRTVWHHNVAAGNVITKKLADILVLAGLGITLLLSLAVTGLGTSATTFLLDHLGLSHGFVANLVIKVITVALAVGADVLLFMFLFTRLPRLATPWRRVLKGAVFASVGFEILKVVGAIYVKHTTSNPIYGAFAVVVGLLVWINLVSRFVLFSAAWTVTAPGDTDVPPSGTADPQAADKAGIPSEFADPDPDEPSMVQQDGAPTPLGPALQGKLDDERDEARTPAGGPRAAQPGATPRSDATRRPPAAEPYPAEPTPAERATKAAARVSLGVMAATAVGVAAMGARSVRDLVRR